VTPLLGLALLAAAPEPSGSCPLIYPVAGDVAAARRIAETVIRNVSILRPWARRSPGGTTYILVVEPDRDDAGKWVAFQMLPPPPPPRHPTELVVQAGGGGLAFKIDRCSGAISWMHFSR
jgi:hypothetical protein